MYLIGYLMVPVIIAYVLARFIVLRTSFGRTNQTLKFWSVFVASFILLAVMQASIGTK